MADVTLPLILGTGLLDGINPCAFAVLIFLLTLTLELSNRRKAMLRTGIIYVFAVYVTYFLAGLGILSFIDILGPKPGLIIYYIAATAAIIFGIVNLRDFFRVKKGFLIKIPEKVKPTIEKYAHKAASPIGAIVLGFLVALFELPCTGMVYFSILALLAESATFITGFSYLLIYNLMFVIPLLIIIILIYSGMKAEHIENWRESGRKWMKLLLALLLITLGILMIFFKDLLLQKPI